MGVGGAVGARIFIVSRNTSSRRGVLEITQKFEHRRSPQDSEAKTTQRVGLKDTTDADGTKFRGPFTRRVIRQRIRTDMGPSRGSAIRATYSGVFKIRSYPFNPLKSNSLTLAD